MIGIVIRELKEQWPYCVVIALLSVLVYSLLGQLEVSRSNERELSRLHYEVFRHGLTNATK